MTRHTDLLPSRSLAVAGGPLGRRASARAVSWAATVVPLLVATAATMALSVAERAHCIQKGWTGSDQFWHACFSDLPALYQLGNLDNGLASYVGGDGARADHPVLTGAVMAWVGGLVPDGSFLDQTRWYFALWALLGTALAVAIVYLTAASRPLHSTHAAQVALSPVLLLTAMVSPDLFGVALASAGIWAWSRRRPAVAGALLGLAVTARTYPLLILLALVILGLRTGRFGAVGRALAAAGGAGAVVLLPFLVANPGAIMRPYELWWDSAAGLGSPWMIPQLVSHPLPIGAPRLLTIAGLVVTVLVGGVFALSARRPPSLAEGTLVLMALVGLGSLWVIPQLVGGPLPTGATTLLAIAGLVVTVLVGAVFALSTRRRPTLAEIALVMVGVALVSGKAFPVQASLWLLPLLALCGLRWRDHLLWAGAEALHFVAVWLYVGGLSKPDRGLPPGWYAVFLTLRVVAVGYLVWRVWHTAAQRAEAPTPDAASSPESLSDPGGPDRADRSKSAGDRPNDMAHLDSDAVVDELAGDFMDAPDQLLVRLA